MSRIYFRCVPFAKEQVTLALESGVDGVIVPRERVEQVAALSRCPVWANEEVASAALTAKADEEAVLARLNQGRARGLGARLGGDSGGKPFGPERSGFS